MMCMYMHQDACQGGAAMTRPTGAETLGLEPSLLVWWLV